MKSLTRVATFAVFLAVWCRTVLASAETPQGRSPIDPKQATPIELEVRGTRPHPHATPNPDALSTTVIPRERLRAPGLSAADALRRESGVEVIQYGGFGSPATAAIRGCTAAQTPVYLGGIRLNDEVAGATDLSTVPLWLIERIEVYRGNAPVALDQFGIGGAIAFEPIKPQKTQASVGAIAGSLGTAGGYALSAQRTAHRTTLVGAALLHTQNDYSFDDNRGTLFVPQDDRQSRQKNADLSLLDAWALNRFSLPGGAQVDVLSNVVQREQGVPRLALVPSEKSRARYQRLLLGVRASTPFGSEGEHQLELATSFLSGRSVYEDPAYELVLLVPHLEVSGRRAAQRASARVQVSPWVAWTSTLDLSVDQLLREDGQRSTLRAQAHTGRVATSFSIQPIPELFFLPVVGVTCRSAIEHGEICDQYEPVGRIAVAYRARSLQVFSGVGRYVRFPTLSELHGGGVLVRGNPHLDSETGLSVDLGARFRDSVGSLDLWADLAAYSRRADRLIGYVRSSQGYLVPMNVQAARVGGLEASGGAELRKRVGLDLALSVADPQDVTEGRRAENSILPFHSRFKAAFGGSLRIDGFRARVSLLHSSGRYADPAGLIVIPGQTSFDLELEQSFLSDALQARVRVANLLDAPRFDVVGYPQPGRTAFVALEARLR